MKRLIIPLVGGLLLVASFAFAGPDRGSTVDPTYPNYGNTWRGVGVAYSTTTPVLISSAAVNSGLGIYTWRFRQIVNSSNGGLMLMPSSSSYAVFSSTQAVYLSSGTSGAGASWVVPGDGAVYGLWSSGTTSGGAAGSEHYWK